MGQPGWLAFRHRLDQEQRRRQPQMILYFIEKEDFFNHQSDGFSPTTIHHVKIYRGNLQHKKFTTQDEILQQKETNGYALPIIFTLSLSVAFAKSLTSTCTGELALLLTCVWH